MKNLNYQTNEIKKYFSKNRVKWDDFYDSEKIILKRNILNNKKILDIGCGCGGLGKALQSKFRNIKYEGIEINAEAAKFGLKNFSNENLSIKNLDFLLLKNKKDLNFTSYDYVISLSCLDWQKNFNKTFAKASKLLKNNSKFIISLRLSKKSSLNNILKSYQFINYSNKKIGDKAPYIIWNIYDLLKIINKNNLHVHDSYGYFRSPSKTAVTPLNEIYYTVLVLKVGIKNLNFNKSKFPKKIFSR